MDRSEAVSTARDYVSEALDAGELVPIRVRDVQNIEIGRGMHGTWTLWLKPHGAARVKVWWQPADREPQIPAEGFHLWDRERAVGIVTSLLRKMERVDGSF